jgi:hypothetical protein
MSPAQQIMKNETAATNCILVLHQKQSTSHVQPNPQLNSLPSAKDAGFLSHTVVMATYRETVQIFLQRSEFTQTLPKAVHQPLLCQVRMHPQRPIAKYCESEKMLTRSSPRLTACVRAKYTATSTVFCPCRSALVGPTTTLILTMKLWKVKKSSDFDHEIMIWLKKM